MAILSKLQNPTVESAREFFNWTVNKLPLFNAEGKQIDGYSEFRSSKGETLHVGNTSYSPWQPRMTLELCIAALDSIGLPYSLKGAGTYEGDQNIFAQFQVNGEDGFTLANGKLVKDLLTMAKGNSERIPVSFWLTMVFIICQNTFRAALRARKHSAMNISIRQTANSDARVVETAKKLVSVLQQRESVKETLDRMAATPITIDDAQRAFLGLVRREIEFDEAGKPVDLSKVGKTHLSNSLDRFDTAFKLGPGADITSREGWFAGVTNVATHGRTDSKAFNPDKQFVTSEFGTSARRKETAFAMAADDTAFAGLIQTGNELMMQLLDRPVVIQSASTMQSTDFARLLEQRN